jgi:cell wall-associated NlpC family hydrolase
MKKFTTISIATVLTVVGCSASVSKASSDDVMTDVTPGISAAPILNPKPAKVSSSITKTAQAIRDKQVRNHAKMVKVVRYLKTRVNRTSYVFSGSSPYGWDCSGMVRWAYARFGLDIPHSANKQAHLGTRVSRPVPGDIVVFAYPGSTNFYHSAIYIGDGKIVHAHQQRKTTVIEPLSSYKKSQIRFVRLVSQAEWLH